MDILYALTIEPIEIFYRYAYIFSLHLVGGYAPALLCLAVLSTIIFTPLKHIANEIQDREKHLQAVLEPQIGKIKRTSTGGERHARISALYKRYAYHPVFAFRSTMGLFLQVPFLFGAYAMISSFAPLEGQSFWKITDLARPDGLLGGVNALPFLMTAFNVAAAYTAKGLSRREHIQSLVIAVFFLIILYTAPAALLIYWTANNFFLMLQNMGERYAAKIFDLLRSRKKLSLKTPAQTARRGVFATVRALFHKQDGAVYSACALALGVTVIGAGPTAFFTSSPDVFNLPYAQVALALAPWMTVWILAAVLLWLLTPQKCRFALALLVAVVTLVALCNAFVFVRDFGAMDGHRFMSREAFGKSRVNKIEDVAILLLVFAGIYAQYRFRLTRHLVSFLRLAALGMAAFCVLAPVFLLSAEERAGTAAKPTTGTITLPANNNRVFGFSKTGPNVLVIIPDMMTGEHIQPLLAENLELQRHFTGFTWYRDTVALGGCTLLSLPSIYGGHDYETDKMSAMKGLSKLDRIQKAMSVLPNALAPKGFDSTFITAGHRIDSKTFLPFIDKKDSFLFVSRLDAVYEQLWNKKIGIKERSAQENLEPFLLAVSLFRVSPFTFKRDIYDQGNWLGSTGSMMEDSMAVALRNAMKVGVLPEVVRAKDSGPTLKIIYTSLTHSPWHLPQDSMVPSSHPLPGSDDPYATEDGRYILHMFTERHLLTMLAELFDRMRELGVYDNTLIVVVSDHGAGDSAALRRAFSKNPQELVRAMTYAATNYPGRPDAVLMIKEAGAAHPFATSDREMQTSDVPSLICGAVGGCDGVPPLPPEGAPRTRVHYVGDSRIEAHPKDGFETEAFRITGPMHTMESWEGPLQEAR